MWNWFSGSKKEILESEAENLFLTSSWIDHSKYVDIEKIRQSFLNIKFFIQNQENLQYYFPDSTYNYLIELKDLKNSYESKKYIRNGIPNKYIKGMIIAMFIENKDKIIDNYKIRFFSIFKNREPQNYINHVPYLTNYFTFEESIHKNFLNSDGIQATKELLWLLYSVIPNIEFCPNLIYVINFSLIFLSKEETFNYLKNIMIEDFKNENINLLRFRFRFNYEDNKKLILAFIECFYSITQNIGNDMKQKFEKIGFKIEELIQDMFFNFFYEYLNFSSLCKFFMCYLREGVKMFYRIAYAIIKTLKNDILEINDKNLVIQTIKEKCFQIRDLDSFFNLAFKFNVKRYNNRYSQIKIIEKLAKKKSINFYIPVINGNSKILSDDDIFQLWNIFPSYYSLKDAKLIYSTEYFDRNLDKIYEICSIAENSCLSSLVLIQSKNNEKFGILMSTPFDYKKIEYYCPSFIAIFTLFPKIYFYKSISEDYNKMIFCNEKEIIIGLDSFGPVLEIDKDLKIGFSFQTNIFGNEKPLSKENKFEISNLEIFTLY
jgi:hypothetical protein